jgi:hypothetical protein
VTQRVVFYRDLTVEPAIHKSEFRVWELVQIETSFFCRPDLTRSSS